LVRVAPNSIHDAVQTTVTLLYWPVVILLSVAMLASLYHLAVPVRTPWRRALPGALMAVALFIAGSAVLRWWLVDAFRGEASIYGPLSATVAILLFLYITALAILFGAELNAEIDRIWPLPETAGARRDEGTARPADLEPQADARVT
jgi:membrane protein